MAWPRLEEVIGQERAVGALRRAVHSGRTHHAWLFSGPSGVGKMLTAKAFAGLLLDPTVAPNLAGDLAPEDGSETRRLLEAGTHPDFAVVTKELAAVSRKDTVRAQKQRNIALEVLLEFLIEPAQRGGVASRGALARRVFVVDEAQLIAREGHGALLKTLEEPADGVVIILITEQEADLPATIRSRCRRLAFGTLSERQMMEWLKRSGPAADDATRDWLMGLADGSPGAFASALEIGLADWWSRLGPMLERARRGRFAPEFAAEVKTLVNAEAERRVERAGPNASKDAANKAAVGSLVWLLGAWARQNLRESAARGEGVERAALAADLIADAERMLDDNAFAEHVFDDLAAQLARV